MGCIYLGQNPSYNAPRLRQDRLWAHLTPRCSLDYPSPPAALEFDLAIAIGYIKNNFNPINGTASILASVGLQLVVVGPRRGIGVPLVSRAIDVVVAIRPGPDLELLTGVGIAGIGQAGQDLAPGI